MRLTFIEQIQKKEFLAKLEFLINKSRILKTFLLLIIKYNCCRESFNLLYSSQILLVIPRISPARLLL